ncbi:helix-turn-helix transcriptional regulator [Pseudonocardia acaciae]|uniref:helix-turn-helix transcriptional regulator n=1 Tax=Pseudonocardia acaciae TaxID=551276 RepID=UPI00048BD72D|nr:AraC family transcriptional regulator [Pseudonocardia acaciae]
MTGLPKDWAVWTRVSAGGGPAMDLMHAQLVRRSYAPHMHEEFAVGACTVGREVVCYRGEAHYAGPGTLVVVEPEEVHTGAPARRAGFAYRVMYPSAALLGELAGSPGRRTRFRDLVIHDPPLARELCAVHAAMARRTGGVDALEVEARLCGVLATLVRRHAVPGPDGQARPVGAVAHRVMARLGDQVVDPPSLAEIAAGLGLSRYQLVRAFRAEVGMPPYAWLAQHRVARARGLLERGARPSELAAAVGFADQAHLTRWFRRVLGVTPGAFRNSVQDIAVV